MSKKYTPSGYQIINLGECDLVNTVTFDAEHSGDTLALMTMCENKEHKPILLSFTDIDDGIKVCGFLIESTVLNTSEEHSFHMIISNGTDYILTVNTESRKITFAKAQ